MPIQRPACCNLGRPSHAGLYLHRYLAEHDTNGEARRKLFDNARDIAISDVYRTAYLRWNAALKSDAAILLGVFRVSDRLMVGLGDTNVLETGLTLHHTYGVPFIPGSALKGLLRHALEEIDASTDARQALFGDTTAAGHFTFLDALYIPGSAPDEKPLRGDVITVHHPKYYSDSSHRWPSDFDDPTPVTFLSAGGSYLVALRGPNSAWRALAFDLLKQALATNGVGGKTSSGYGRGELVLGDVIPKASVTRSGGANIGDAPAPASPAFSPGAEPLRKIQALRQKDVKGQLS